MTISSPRDPLEDAGDAAALDAFRAVARMEPPSRFATARAGRDLDAALDREARRLAPWTPARVAIVASLAACVGAAIAVGIGVDPGLNGPFAVAPHPEALPSLITAAPAAAPAVPPSFPAVPTADAQDLPSPPARGVATSVAAPPEEEPARLDAQRSARPATVALARRTGRGWREEAERLLDAGDGTAAARVLVSALARDEGAAADLALVARRFPAALETIDDDLARLRGAEAMRLRCEQRLLRARDRRALDACRAFGQQHPEHPGARTLSYAAGRVAEDELGDLAAAEEEYSRALLLSPFAGLPATDVLLARARVRGALGDLEEARADLRLYLHQEPLAERDPSVRRLATDLGVHIETEP